MMMMMMMMMMINKCDPRIEFFCLFVYVFFVFVLPSPLSLGKLPLEAIEPFFLLEQKRSLYFSLKLLNLSERCIFYRTVSLAPSVNTMTFPWRECACQEMVTRWSVVRMIKASNFGTWVMLRMFPWIPAVKGRAQLLQRQPQMTFLLISNMKPPWHRHQSDRAKYPHYRGVGIRGEGNCTKIDTSGTKGTVCNGVAQVVRRDSTVFFCESLFLFSLTGDVFVSSILLTISLIDFLKRYWS